MHRVIIVIAVLISCSASFRARAQYSLDWRTMDGGGGTSSGGAYSLSATIGQPDAQAVSLCSLDGGTGCSNPSYELVGGYWAGVPVPCGGNLDCIFRDGFEFTP